MHRTILFFFVKIIFISFCWGQNYTISGQIIDNKSGESCIGVSIYDPSSYKGASSNSYGFYSLELPKGEYSIVYSAIGFKTDTIKIVLTKNIILNNRIEANNIWLDEIAVISTYNKVKQTELSVQELDIKSIKGIPAIMGEPDLLKTLQLLPGVQTASEGSTNLSIRGGSFDQNLILLDGAPVYNPSHALGFFSTFNPDALKSVKLYTGAFPAEYGGRISSVIDIHMKEGNNKTMVVTGGVGLIASRLTIETPIIKDRMSVLISGRYSYAGTVLNESGKLGQDLGMNSLQNFKANNEIAFFDLNLKTNLKINERNHLYLST